MTFIILCFDCYHIFEMNCHLMMQKFFLFHFFFNIIIFSTSYRLFVASF